MRGAATTQQADERSMGCVERVPERADPPTEGLQPRPRRFYLARHRDGGVGGLELYGAVALLCPLAVDPSERGQGYGAELCDSLGRRARGSGVETLSAFRTSAESFFSGRGYEETERAAVPEAIREAAEFKAAEPSTAILPGEWL